jgi:hypothetical protein
MSFKIDKSNSLMLFKSLERGAKIQLPLDKFVALREFLEFEQTQKLIYVCNEYFCRIEHTKPNENDCPKTSNPQNN